MAIRQGYISNPLFSGNPAVYISIKTISLVEIPQPGINRENILVFVVVVVVVVLFVCLFSSPLLYSSSFNNFNWFLSFRSSVLKTDLDAC